MLGRVQRILLKPREEWPRIAAEPATAKETFMKWAVPLAAIPAVASFLGGQLFGYGAFGLHYKPAFVPALTNAVVQYAMALVGVWVIALIIDWLAPNFNATKGKDAAMKVAAYSYTAGWVAGALLIVPSLAVIAGLAGLYGFYLLWLGLPIVMRAPADKATSYTAVTVVAAIVVYLIAGAVVSAVAASAVVGPAYSAGAASGTVTVPGGGSVDLGKLDAAAKQLEAQANGAPAKLVAGGELQNLLPASVGGWTRTAVENESGGAAGVGAATATGTYVQGGDQIKLSVSDLGAMGALAGLGAAFNVNTSKETANGYEKTTTADGRLINEKWDSSDRRGSYTTVLGNRFSISAEGTAPNADALKGVVAAVDAGRLVALAK
jgi:hypothetical protein